MTPNDNAQKVDAMPTNNAKGLEEVLGLLGKATPDWRAYRFGVIRAGEFREYQNGAAQSQIASFTGDCDDAENQRDIDRDAACVAVNYLRSHGAAIAELIEADKEYDEAHRSEADTDGLLRREDARIRRAAALRQVGGK